MRTGFLSRALNKTDHNLKQQRWLRHRPEPGSQRSGYQNGCLLIIRLRILITRLKINYQNAHYLLKTYFFYLFLKLPEKFAKVHTSVLGC